MHFITVRGSECLALVLISVILFGSFNSVDGNDHWLSYKEIEYSGDFIFIFFTPEPGMVSMETETIRGIINVTSNNDDYSIRILISAYGIIQDNETVFSNEEGLDIHLGESIDTYMEEIELIAPKYGNFTAYMVMDSYWLNESTIVYNETINLAANYRKIRTGFDLAGVLFAIGLLIVATSFLMIVGSVIKRIRYKRLDLSLIKEKQDTIKKIISSYFTEEGEFREIDLENVKPLQKPGEISLMRHQRKSKLLMLERIKSQISEMNELGTRYEAAREPILNNPLFMTISSLFLKASEKSVYYPHASDINSHLQEVRNSLQEGRWDQLNDVTKIKFAWEICEEYAKSLPLEPDLQKQTMLDFDLEAIKLAGQIRNYQKVKRENPLPYSRDLIFRSKDDLSKNLELIDHFLENYKTISKKDLSHYAKDCAALKKDVETTLEYLKTYEKQAGIVDTDLLPRLEDRVSKLSKLIAEEITLANKMK